MPPNTQQTVHIFETINIPQHALIRVIWDAFKQIPFSVSTNTWITPTQFSQPGFPTLQIWRPMPQSPWELLAGFRTYNLAKTASLKEMVVIERTGLSEAEAFDIAMNDILLPLLIWSHGNKSSNTQVLYFCKTVRQNLPELYRKQLPRQTEFRQWLNLGEYVSRKQPATPSKLAQLRLALSSAVANVNNEESVHHGKN